MAPLQTPLQKSSAKTWLGLHFHQLSLDIASRDTEADSLPLVITENQRVYQRNDLAKQLGIKPGHSMDTAFTLSDQVASIERNTDKETAALQQLGQWAYQFTPNVSIKAPYCLLMEVASSLSLFKGLESLLQKIRSGLQAQGYAVWIAVANTPQAAILLSTAGENFQLQVEDSHTPVEDSHTPVEDSQIQVGSVPVSYLQVSDKIITGLQQMGIHQVEQVLALPLSGLSRRFGAYFADYLQRLTGEKPDPQTFISPAANFYQDITFVHDVTNLASLAFPINRLLKELNDFLSGRQFWISHLTWHLSHRNAQPKRQSFSVHLAAPANDTKMFLALTQLKLDQVNNVKQVDNIALSVKRFSPAGQSSDDLFSNQGFSSQGAGANTGSNSEQQNQLLNQFTARLGAGKCFGLSEANDHRPEKAWKKIRLHEKDYWISPKQEDLPRPTFLLPTPRALNVVANVPCLSGKLELLKGPERIDFGWWDQPIDKPLARDYYIARQREGGLLWVFKHLDAQRWYLHGIFS